MERSYASRIYGGKTIDSVAEFEDVAQSFGEHNHDEYVASHKK